MAILYKNGTVLSDYTRFVVQSNGTRIGYIFRLMSNGWVLVRPHRVGGRWKRFRKDRKLSNVQMTTDAFLRSELEEVFD